VSSIAEILGALGRPAGAQTDGGPRCAQCDGVAVRQVGRLCAECDEAERLSRRRAMLAAAWASVPPAFRGMDARQLVARTRMPDAVLARATEAIARPRVVLVGASGVGKTSLACWMLREVLDAALSSPADLLRRARWARFVDAGRLCRAVREHPLGEGEAAMLSGAIGASICVLDDVGLELQLRMPSNPVVDVIRERHAAAKPTWVTTFLAPQAFENAYGSGTARRVFDGATVLSLDGSA
jgi:DNA replication protein DnaC